MLFQKWKKNDEDNDDDESYKLIYHFPILTIDKEMNSQFPRFIQLNLFHFPRSKNDENGLKCDLRFGN